MDAMEMEFGKRSTKEEREAYITLKREHDDLIKSKVYDVMLTLKGLTQLDATRVLFEVNSILDKQKNVTVVHHSIFDDGHPNFTQ